MKTCPTGAIHFGTKKEMLDVAQARVDKLKARGYENAGIYNPQGVGGTHVMYVLHHNDQPELYHNLPKDPAIDTSINLWKGALKPLSAAGFIATFAGLIYHYIGIGPNKEVDDDEESIMSKSKMIVRTKFVDRACHWTVVICFFLVAVSGISFFFPTLQWLTETFGTPQMGRILHPFFGVLIFVVLMFMFVRFVHHNIPDKQDYPVAERDRRSPEGQ